MKSKYDQTDFKYNRYLTKLIEEEFYENEDIELLN